MMKRFAALAAAILMLAAPLVQAQEMREVTDAFGQKVQVPAQPTRVVVLSELELDSTLTLGLTPKGAVKGRRILRHSVLWQRRRSAFLSRAGVGRRQLERHAKIGLVAAAQVERGP
jgi:ABC-type Fe3+-citrate transport system substrate-binding protein